MVLKKMDSLRQWLIRSQQQEAVIYGDSYSPLLCPAFHEHTLTLKML